MAQAPVSVVLLTYNESQQIEQCLQTVAGWCQELHVVDSGSTDGTVELARKYTDQIHFHPFVDHVSQLTWVLQNLPMGCDWMLLLYADHRVTDDLKNEIAEALLQPAEDVDGFYNAHRILFRGKPVRGFKSWSLQLIRHRHAYVESSELVDARFVVRGRTAHLTGAIIEDNENERDIDVWIDRHQRYSTRQAAEEVLRMNGLLAWSATPNLFGNYDQRIIWLKQRWYALPLFVRPLLYFTYRYVLKGGALDGRNGLVYHVFQGLWHRLLVDVKIEELRRHLASGSETLDGLYRRHVGRRLEATSGPAGVVTVAEPNGSSRRLPSPA